jgi:uncharacterized protein YecE (DUF72 family)
MMAPSEVRVGTAGWSIARDRAADFPAEGTSLERYAAVLPCAEINSSFHRPHRTSTWAKWRDSVPTGFRFSVKLPKSITHERRLLDCAGPLDTFLAGAGELGAKLAVLLVQLPPSLSYDRTTAERFLRLFPAGQPRVVVEPRHASWFDADAERLLEDFGIARVGADPARVAAAAAPLVVDGLAYWRLHGSPVIYRSSYADRIGALAAEIAATDAADKWVIFDNTASSAATGDALAVQRSLATYGLASQQSS